MSRSYKKHPWAGDNKGKWKKRIANSKVRNYLKNYENTLKFSDFKKVHESWEICDYGWLYTWEQYWEYIVQDCKRFNLPIPDKKQEYRNWFKTYKMK